jgi:NAD(P)-dependent dehydrogenase (short-subunit alcohol dehydrogenase family)
MSRTYVITGASSGIGLVTSTLLKTKGNKVIGVDIKGSDVNFDLSDSGQTIYIDGGSDAALRGENFWELAK